jgi:hypothetical protein
VSKILNIFGASLGLERRTLPENITDQCGEKYTEGRK